MPGELFSHLAFVGVFVQGAVALLLAILFLSLRRLASHRPYLRDWSVAFVGLAIAIAAIFVRYVANEVEGTRFLYVLYQAAKLAFFTCVLSGALRFAGRKLPLPRLPLAIGLAVYAVASVLVRRDLNGVVLWQTPIAIVATAVAGAVMLRLPAERRSLGTRMTGVCCLVLTLLWVVYAIGFALESLPPNALGRFLESTKGYNSFIDVVMQSVLGVGMVVALFQDLAREAEASRTERSALQARLAETRHLESLGVVVSGVAHDLNNPLTAILGYSEELAESNGDTSDDASKSPARVIYEQAQRCRSIVRDLLAFARPRPPARELVEPGPLVQRVVRGFAPKLRRADVSVDVSIADDLPRLLAESSALEQVLANLIDNAIDASPAGSRIAVSARRHGDRCELIVEDEGPGVPAALAARIFEPFFTTKTPGHGTGLGLAVSHRIVTTHGGSIRLEPRADGRTGSRFVILLPPDPAAARPKLPRVEPCIAPAPILSTNGSGSDASRILVVDGEPSVRSLLRRRFEQHGWSVVEAESGPEAVARSRAAAFDVAVVDLRTRGIAELGLHAQLARGAAPLARRTIAIATDVLSPEATNFAAAARSPVFDKPLDLERLVACVASLAGRGLSRPVAGSA